MSSAASRLFCVANRTVLITGGGRGIGSMLAQGYYEAGANVIVTSRTEDSLKETVSTILENSAPPPADATPSLSYVVSDVSSREGCEKLASDIGPLLPDGRLDVLINNAGNAWGEPLERESGKMNWGWDKVLDLNLKGVFYLSRSCLPYMKQEGETMDRFDPSRIINIGSVVGLMPQDAPTHAYDVSKAGVHHLTKKLSGDLAPHNITVNALAPGFVPSRMTEGLKSYTTFDDIAKNTPLRRLGDGDDMTGACIYLSSRAGSYVTGVILNVDGGTVGASKIPLSFEE
ncbi:hypothetical protein TrRE_jg3191 [Triparma retinervis]|uniref:Uncharacterized protein n=1 Tax=Triparma retinervis TaxID=2557542 RepID=A0A9W7AB61_9STRA|nr:hypothetical protein TrRE_jg3191 [Triparma retinervis]